MAYSPSPLTAPHSPHMLRIRNATNVLSEPEKYLSELLVERQKLAPFLPVLPRTYRVLNQEVGIVAAFHDSNSLGMKRPKIQGG